MFKSFRHRGLQRYFETGDHRDLRTDQVKRIRRVLAILDAGASVGTLETLAGMRLHPLKGGLDGFWSTSVTGNWRILFRFDAGQMHDVDFVDYDQD
jgi:proteic killer suppression protein